MRDDVRWTCAGIGSAKRWPCHFLCGGGSTRALRMRRNMWRYLAIDKQPLLSAERAREFCRRDGRWRQLGASQDRWRRAVPQTEHEMSIRRSRARKRNAPQPRRLEPQRAASCASRRLQRCRHKGVLLPRCPTETHLPRGRGVPRRWCALRPRPTPWCGSSQ